MDIILEPLFHLLTILVRLFTWALILSVVLSWLVAFGIVNSSNQFISTVGEFLFRITEPALQPIRKFLPNLGGIDISPLVLILGMYFLLEILEKLITKIIG